MSTVTRAGTADMCDILESVKDQLTTIENELATNTETCEVYDNSKPSLLDMPVEVSYSYFSTFSKVDHN